MQLRVEPPEIWIQRLDPGAPLPDGALDGPWCMVARTPGETTVAAALHAPGASGPHRVLRVDGPLEHALGGVLVQLLVPLAAVAVPVFAVSSFDTDHVLVPADRLDTALAALRAAGHTITEDLPPVGADTHERDWTRVAEERCAECGVDAAAVPPDELAFEVRRAAAAWTRLLRSADDAAVRTRPAPDVWSPLEYACHVRDTWSLFAQRIVTTLREDEPDLGPWDPEAAVTEDGYNEQDVASVADDIERNAEVLAAALALAEGDWERGTVRHGTERVTVAGLGRFALHEGRHHLVDAGGSGP